MVLKSDAESLQIIDHYPPHHIESHPERERDLHHTTVGSVPPTVYPPHPPPFGTTHFSWEKAGKHRLLARISHRLGTHMKSPRPQRDAHANHTLCAKEVRFAKKNLRHRPLARETLRLPAAEHRWPPRRRLFHLPRGARRHRALQEEALLCLVRLLLVLDRRLEDGDHLLVLDNLRVHSQ